MVADTPTAPRLAVKQSLFALSGNECAFPGCEALMYDDGAVVGEICHIHAQRPGGARYREDLSAEEVHGIENLILLCRRHHKVIDDHPDKHTADWLRQAKKQHELRAPNTPTRILVALDIESRLDKIRALMPDLLEEMQNDVAGDDTQLIREFVVLRSRGNVFNSTKARFFYFEEEHPNLQNMIDLLEEYGFVRDITFGNTPIYRFEEDFVEFVVSSVKLDPK